MFVRPVFLQCNFFLSLNLLCSNLCVSVYVWSFANMWRCIKSAIKKSLTISAFVVASVVTVGSQNITRVSVCERTIIICWEMVILQLLLVLVGVWCVNSEQDFPSISWRKQGRSGSKAGIVILINDLLLNFIYIFFVYVRENLLRLSHILNKPCY